MALKPQKKYTLSEMFGFAICMFFKGFVQNSSDKHADELGQKSANHGLRWAKKFVFKLTAHYVMMMMMMPPCDVCF